MPYPSLLKLVAACALAWGTAGCAANASSDATSGTGDDGSAPTGESDAGADSGADSSTDTGVDGRAPTDAHVADGASDSGHKDVELPPPAVPACKSGDRKEWAGVVANTGIALAVCSVCGASYVVATNGSGAAGTVTVDNGSKTITLDVADGKTATSASLADKASDGTVAVCATGASHACLTKDPRNEKYCDPYRSISGLTPERIDQGVDYAGSGPIYAIGPGTIDLFDNRNDTGWPGGTFASYKLSAGPAAGRTIYLAENIDLDTKLKSGSFVYSGTVLGTLVNAYPNLESGWGVPGEGVTAEYSCYTEGCMTPLGVNFNKLLVCLKAPSGTTGTGGCCPQPSGWPSDWCTLLSAWQ
ncbi:MAG TPA: hypothetical protein VF765_37570 [Polyangiaceae bacterium]